MMSLLLTLHDVPSRVEREVRESLAGLFPDIAGGSHLYDRTWARSRWHAESWARNLAGFLESRGVSFRLRVTEPAGDWTLRFCPQYGRLELPADGTGRSLIRAADVQDLSDLIATDRVAAMQQILRMTGGLHDLAFEQMRKAREPQTVEVA